MPANPTIQKLGRELIALYMGQGVTCEQEGRGACYHTPEYRCTLGPFMENVGADGLINFSKDLCPSHAKRFARTFNLVLPSKWLQFGSRIRKPAAGQDSAAPPA
jgi:hypothetical protein